MEIVSTLNSHHSPGSVRSSGPQDLLSTLSRTPGLCTSIHLPWKLLPTLLPLIKFFQDSAQMPHLCEAFQNVLRQKELLLYLCASTFPLEPLSHSVSAIPHQTLTSASYSCLLPQLSRSKVEISELTDLLNDSLVMCIFITNAND